MEGPYDLDPKEQVKLEAAVEGKRKAAMSAEDIVDELISEKKALNPDTNHAAKPNPDFNPNPQAIDRDEVKMLERLNVRRQARQAQIYTTSAGPTKGGKKVVVKTLGDELKNAGRIQTVMAYLQELRMFRFVSFEVK